MECPECQHDFERLDGDLPICPGCYPAWTCKNPDCGRVEYSDGFALWGYCEDCRAVTEELADLLVVRLEAHVAREVA